MATATNGKRARAAKAPKVVNPAHDNSFLDERPFDVLLLYVYGDFDPEAWDDFPADYDVAKSDSTGHSRISAAKRCAELNAVFKMANTIHDQTGDWAIPVQRVTGPTLREIVERGDS